MARAKKRSTPTEITKQDLDELAVEESRRFSPFDELPEPITLFTQQREDAEGTLNLTWRIIPINQLHKAPWNYKTEDETTSEKLRNNLADFGQMENMTVRLLTEENAPGEEYREKWGQWEIANGNHRKDEYEALGWRWAVCCDLGPVPVRRAQLAALLENETRFDADPLSLAKLVTDLTREGDVETLLAQLPYDEPDLTEFQKMVNWDWDEITPTEATTRRAAPSALQVPHNLLLKMARLTERFIKGEMKEKVYKENVRTVLDEPAVIAWMKHYA